MKCVCGTTSGPRVSKSLQTKQYFSPSVWEISLQVGASDFKMQCGVKLNLAIHLCMFVCMYIFISSINSFRK